jgi:2-haloacid dehalogenase
MLDFSRFEFLTFDCYGTLIDWETGILRAVRPILASHGIERDDESLLALYAELEAAAEVGEFKAYREVLEGVVRGLGARLKFAPSAEEIRSLNRWRSGPHFRIRWRRCNSSRHASRWR